jgi:alpha-L-fucosidase
MRLKKFVKPGSYILLITILFFHAAFMDAQENKVTGKLFLLDSDFIFSNAPFQSCHASSLVALPGNKIMAVWFGGKHESNPDVSIWASVNEKGVWSDPKEIANGIQNDALRYACWNPVLFKSRSGLLFLHYKVGRSPREWWAEMKISADNGVTWSSTKKLPDGFLGPIKNKPMQLKNGDILYPSSTESNDNIWTIHIERSDSLGNNWKKINIDCDTFNVIQPSLLTYANGRMQLLCRSKQNVIAESWSFDNGNTWQKVRATSLSNPNSGIDVVSLANGAQMLVYNPLPHGNEWWEGRSVLRVAVSIDGKDWRDIFTLEEHKEGEYSYPAVIQSSDGIIHISYTSKRKKIKYVRLKF